MLCSSEFDRRNAAIIFAHYAAIPVPFCLSVCPSVPFGLLIHKQKDVEKKQN